MREVEHQIFPCHELAAVNRRKRMQKYSINVGVIYHTIPTTPLERGCNIILKYWTLSYKQAAE